MGGRNLDKASNIPSIHGIIFGRRLFGERASRFGTSLRSWWPDAYYAAITSRSSARENHMLTFLAENYPLIYRLGSSGSGMH